MNILKNYCLYLHFIIYIRYTEIEYNLGIKTILYLKYIILCNRTNGLVGVKNRKAEQPAKTRTANGANKKLVLHLRLGCGSLSVTTPVSLLAN